MCDAPLVTEGYMLTKARIKGHPIHPMLIAFPVALYTATVVAIFVHLGTGDPFWYRAAVWTNIAGVVMAGVAAIPGVIDLLTLPSHSRARVTGLRHAGLNVLALALFVASAIVLGNSWAHHEQVATPLDDAAPLVITILGLLATVAAGWLGWTLVQTHHVGIKPTRHVLAEPAPRDRIDDLDELDLPFDGERERVRHIPVH